MEHIVFFLFAAFLTGSIKGSFGVGSGILPVFLLSLYLPPEKVIVILYPTIFNSLAEAVELEKVTVKAITEG